MERHERNEAKLQTRVDHHVDRLVTQYKRFERLTEQVQRWAERWTTDALRRHLALAEDTETRERALVALALQATATSGRIIDDYIPRSGGEEHELFHCVVRIEWERRRDDHTGSLAA